MNTPHWLGSFPLIAILRGLSPDDAPWVGQALFDHGFRLLEVPLNRPGALDAIKVLRDIAPADALIGAGTVLTVEQVDAIHQVGAQLAISPNCVPEVIQASKAKGMLSLPGVATATEAFAALDAGADALKLFPADSLPQSVIKAWLSVLPAHTAILPVGGIRPDNMQSYFKAGAAGFGIGSNLYQPGVTPDQLASTAKAFQLAWLEAQQINN